MRRRLLILAAILVLTGLASGGGWYLLRIDPEPTDSEPSPVRLVRATNAEIDLLETQAGEACRCARRRHETPWQSACYAGYRRSLARYEHEEWTAMCMPISPHDDCFPLGGGRQRCITRDWGGDACSNDEARILEAIDADSERRPTEARERWAAAVQSFIRGERVRVSPHGGGGCSG